VTGGTSTGNGYIRISPFYGISCPFEASGMTWTFVLPMTAWVPPPGGYNIHRVCESRGMELYVDQIPFSDSFLGAFNSCPYASARQLFLYGTPPEFGNVCNASNGFIFISLAGPSCDELDPSFGIMAALCLVPNNYGSLPT